jgi:hypothetical protein
MSTVGRRGRSFVRIERSDLRRLARIAADDRRQFFAAHPDWRRLYEGRVVAVALCQGAANHYVDARTGVNDLDVYTFYAVNPARHWYAKRNKHRDFGDPKFGQSIDRPDFVGRRVDLLGRDIPYRPGEDPVEAVQRWLALGLTKSARLLARKAVVVIEPANRCGDVAWHGVSDED